MCGLVWPVSVRELSLFMGDRLAHEKEVESAWLEAEKCLWES